MGRFLEKWASTPPAGLPVTAVLKEPDRTGEQTQANLEPDPAELARAAGVLNRAGVRIMSLEGRATIGVWADLDGPEVRAALRILGADRVPVRYLDGAGIPMRYKLRRVAGEPVPMSVLAEMKQHPADPWKVRDRMTGGALHGP